MSTSRHRTRSSSGPPGRSARSRSATSSRTRSTSSSGAYVTSDAKHGVDAGEVAGIGPLGVACTTDKDEILALDADCVNYAPLYIDIDDMCAILRSGKNIVTPVGFAYPPGARPRARPLASRPRARRAAPRCTARASTRASSATCSPLTGARLMSRIDQVVVTEIYLLAQHPSYEMNFPGLGFGRDPVECRRGPVPHHQEHGGDLPGVDGAARRRPRPRRRATTTTRSRSPSPTRT